MTLGTADAEGRPWVSPVCFATADYAEFYWVSAHDAAHSRNIAQRPQVSLVIFDSQVPTYHGRAVYLSATASELAGRDLDRGIGIYPGPATREASPVTADDVTAPSPYRLYRVAVTEAFVLCPREPRQPVSAALDQRRPSNACRPVAAPPVAPVVGAALRPADVAATYVFDLAVGWLVRDDGDRAAGVVKHTLAYRSEQGAKDRVMGARADHQQGLPRGLLEQPLGRVRGYDPGAHRHVRVLLPPTGKGLRLLNFDLRPGVRRRPPVLRNVFRQVRAGDQVQVYADAARVLEGESQHGVRVASDVDPRDDRTGRAPAARRIDGSGVRVGASNHNDRHLRFRDNPTAHRAEDGRADGL
jgi:Pyridoxamine 5'-phosphate oxidase